MKNRRITIIFMVLLCCSLVLTGCKDAKKEKTTAEAAEVKANVEIKASAVKAAAEKDAAEKAIAVKAAADKAAIEAKK